MRLSALENRALIPQFLFVRDFKCTWQVPDPTESWMRCCCGIFERTSVSELLLGRVFVEVQSNFVGVVACVMVMFKTLQKLSFEFSMPVEFVARKIRGNCRVLMGVSKEPRPTASSQAGATR